MARIRSVDFLPEIFQTNTNRQFLGATLDQMIQEPKLKRSQGFIGKRSAPGSTSSDRYIVEPTATRSQYQLEPTVVFRSDNNGITDAITYPGMIDALEINGGNVSRHDRLWKSQFYTWDPMVDLDKFVNYSQYYWLPAGPDPVDVSATDVPISDSFDVTRGSSSYTFTDVFGNNPVITLVRGGSYTFNVRQTGNPFWIQAAPGVDGVLPYSLNISSRDVLGVVNNGDDNGTITFNVPMKDAQAFYYGLNDLGLVDFATQLKFNQINNQYVDIFLDQYGGIDGIADLEGRTIIFLEQEPDAEAGGWQVTTLFDNSSQMTFENLSGTAVSTTRSIYKGITPTTVSGSGTGMVLDVEIAANSTSYSTSTVTIKVINPGNNYSVGDEIKILGSQLGGTDITNDLSIDVATQTQNGSAASYDSTVSFDQTTDISTQAQRYSIWQIQFVADQDGRDYMVLANIQSVTNLSKVKINYGNEYSSVSFYKNASGYWERIPLLTAVMDEIYYQDGNNPELFGAIRFIEQDAANPILISDIVGKTNYTSPNGVVFTNGLKVQFRGPTFPSNYQDNEYYVEGVGSSITLLDVNSFVTPETYTQSNSAPYDSVGFDIEGFDGSLNQPTIPDYLTINRASQDLNPWTRSNRWFHADVISASAEYNSTVAVFDQTKRAQRPIIEFDAGLRLWNFGTQGKTPVNIIDTRQTDALSNVNGQLGYSVDGYSLISGSRIIFANDQDPAVRNKIYEVEFIEPDSDTIDGSSIDQPIINLVPAVDSAVSTDQTVVILSGITLQGKSFSYNGSVWTESQQKTSTNQAPLFDVFDTNDVSLGNLTSYPSTTFAGTKLFSYREGTGVNDPVLNFPLTYLNINNVGDILFDNNLYTDSFLYVINSVSTETDISIGHARKYNTRTSYLKKLGWQTAVVENLQRQIFDFVYQSQTLVLDVLPKAGLSIPAIKIYVNGAYVLSSTYTVTENSDGTTFINFLSGVVANDQIEVQIISDQASRVAYYEIPDNLQSNPLNQNSPSLTLGGIRTHYGTICENLLNLTGSINGNNNTRDLGNIIPYGESILQQSSPVVIAASWLRDPALNIFSSIDFSRNEYEKFKAQILDTAININIYGMTSSEILDECLGILNLGKGPESPFYWSDALPGVGEYSESTITITPITGSTFDLTQTYDFTKANYQAVLVYVNDVLLVGDDHEYIVATDGPRVTVLVDLAVGDVVKIREYSSTVGNYCPATPSKLGLFPAYEPEMFLDNTYTTPTNVIRGHDGSLTVAFGDFRDDLLLEFERRIYNNIKVTGRYDPPIKWTDVIPGQFRSTDYSESEITEIMNRDFLAWVGYNKLDYKTQEYDASNEFTWNYSTSSSSLDNSLLKGNWRGVYHYYYDTDSPHTRPWEMLGITEQPTWWEDRYGPAPYTSDNLVLWEDLEAGIVADPAGSYIKPAFVRPNLTSVIPTDSEGNLLSPFVSIVKNYDPIDFRKSWVSGDEGPVETVWRRSSSWPFAVMRLLALTKPAEFFSLFIDRDRYRYNTDFSQWLYDDRYRIDLNNIEIYGSGTSKNSYINWSVDWNRNFGIDTITEIQQTLGNLNVQLGYRMASYTDKKYLKILTEKTSPQSQNTSLLVPDESYSLLLYRNQPFNNLTFSSVIVQKTIDGYAVLGYSTTQPYFEIAMSVPNGNYTSFTVNDTTYRLSRDFTENTVLVPYGYVFQSKNGVIDFLNSYGYQLARQGMIFENYEDGYILDWNRMAQEFINWSNQGWAVGSVINLNPGAKQIRIKSLQSVADPVNLPRNGTQLLDQNKQPISNKNIVIDRIDDEISINSIGDQTLNYVNLNFTAYEHLLLLDNVTIFNDLIYDPVTGVRQERLNLNGFTTYEWNGLLDPQGFIFNRDNVDEWNRNRKYTKGQLVKFKDVIWSASGIIEPGSDFDFDMWIKSDYDQIQKGLLPNIATKSEQLMSMYDKNTVNLESDSDLLAYGLIGYRPRQYMQDIDLDDVSQVGVYQQFIATKGSRQATDLFRGAVLDKEVAEYDIYENWAIKRATYGANANRTYVEFRLNESLLQANPSVVQVINPGQTSEADQSVLVSNIYKESKNFTSANIFPVTNEVSTDTGLPSAGYVNENDVDFKAFTLDSLTAETLNNIAVGSSIWVAKINNHDWSIYRTTLVPAYVVQLSDNLDGRSIMTFDKNHELSLNDIVVVRYFNDAVDGTYKVLAIPALNSILVEFSFSGPQTTITGTGTAMVLRTTRVAQASDVAALSFANDLRPGAKAWVDNDGTGNWAVYQKTQPFTSESSLTPRTPVASANYGASIAQGYNNLIAAVGSPGYNSNVGALYTYVRTGINQYEQNNIITPAITDMESLGNAVDIGYDTWMVVGAKDSMKISGQTNGRGLALIVNKDPSSNAFNIYQVLVPEIGEGLADEFGYSVAISRDERFAYIGCPGRNRVYCYGRVDLQTQTVSFTGDGSTISFPVTDYIVVDNKDQIAVVVDNVVSTDFTLVDGVIRFTTGAPDDGASIVVSRKSSLSFTGDGIETSFDLTDLYTVSDIYSFTVTVNGVPQRPKYDYDFGDPSTLSIEFVTAPSIGATIVVRSRSYFTLIDVIQGVPALSPLPPERFGHSIATTTDGRQLIVGCPLENTSGPTALRAGKTYIYDRSVEQFIATSANVTSKTIGPVIRPLTAPTNVYKNGVLLTNTSGNIGGDYTISGSNIVLEVAPEVGDVFEIDTNEFALIQQIDSEIPNQGAQFGYSVDQCTNNCSVYIGAPYDSVTAPEAGCVERWVNQNRLYGTITGSVSNPTLTVGNTLRINNVDVEATGTTIDSFIDDINNANLPNVTAVKNSSSQLVISVTNADAVVGEFNKLSVLPGLTTSGTSLMTALGLTPYVYTQTIRGPADQEYSHFGSSVIIDDGADNLIVSAPDGTVESPTTFDNFATYFDSDSTTFTDPVPQSGVVYTFDYLNSANGSISNPGQFAFGQQILASDLGSLDKFGTALSYITGTMLITAPSWDGTSTVDSGKIYLYANSNRVPAWTVIHRQTPRTNVALINSIYVYNRLDQSVQEYLDFIDPLQGKILGAARQNIDFINTVDPASYNVGDVNNTGTTWREDHLNTVWWDISNARFIDYNQDDIVYASRRWGQLFTGSRIEVYQWVQSDLPPQDYTGPGIPRNTTDYSITTGLNNDGTFETRYFFWVRGLTSTAKNKTLSVSAIEQYIVDPRSSGVAYAAVIDSSTVALYNTLPYISATDTILDVEFDQILTDNNVHVEYQLISVDNPTSFLPAGLYRKLQDSLCGVDTLGNLVPDPNLSPADTYGVEFRPRQSMFINRFSALENYFTRVNTILAQYPIREDRRYPLLLSRETEPSVVSNAWDKRVTDLEELGFQNLSIVPTGYRYLVAKDSNNDNLWTIYTKSADGSLSLSRVQNYDTNRYWNYINWYQPGFSSLTRPSLEVASYSSLATLSVALGTIVKVTSNSSGLWEIYEYTSAGWIRRALQNGTIEISSTLWNYNIDRFGFDSEVFDAQYFDQEPVTETRKIIQSINEELLIDNLAVERNRALVLLFDFIMTEQTAPEWLVRTSLVDVEHKIRDLIEYPIYNQDNQDFVQNYFDEVKPYHVKVKEFRLRYDASDEYSGDLTDFDVPAFYNNTWKKYISPILDDSTPPLDEASSYPSDSEIWTTRPWSYWYDNYLLSIESVVIVDGGEGYTVAPEITVSGECVRQATMVAMVNSAGQVDEIVVTDPGLGYTSTAVVTISGGNGTGAKAVAYMGNGLVRSFTTVLKYNRCEYTQTVVDWLPNTMYEDGTLIRYQDKVYSASSPDSSAVDSGAEFDPDYYTEVDPSTLSAADRTMGLYVPDVNRIGLDLALLINGIDYPGVQVTGPLFSQNTGFDVGAFDVAPFDNIDYGPEGLPTYDPGILDTIYESYWGTDGTLTPTGTAITDINVEGGGFIDTYSSHAPEELVPGSMFDALDIKVFTRPGADWSEHGFAWPSKQISYKLTQSSQTVSFDGVLDYPGTIVVTNSTSRTSLHEGEDFTVNWTNKTITLLTAGSDEIVKITVYSIGGGNQLLRTGFLGNAITNNRYRIPVAADEIQYLAVLIDGDTYSSTSIESIDDYNSYVVFGSAISANSWVALTVLGFETGTTRSWSAWVSGTSTYDGSTRSFTSSDALIGSNAANMIVEVNGKRLRPPEGAFYVADGVQDIFDTSTSGDIDSALIAPNEVSVYVNDRLLTQSTEYILLPYDSSSYLSVQLTETPAEGDRVVVYVRTMSPYYITGNNIIIKDTYSLSNGDFISWRSFKDTTQQRLRTKVFKGPTSSSSTTTVAFDAGPYDAVEFDYTVTVGVDTLIFDLQTTDIREELAWVTFNGDLLLYGENYTVTFIDSSAFLVLTGIEVTANDIIAVTFGTQYYVNPAITYRVTQDMLNNRKIYRINASGTAVLTQPVDQFSTRIYVDDVNKLPKPNLDANEFGTISIDGEWIYYRNWDADTNSVGDLRRGVAGTGMDNHSVGALVYNLSSAELLPVEYQDSLESQTFTGDGTTKFYTTTIEIDPGDSSGYGSPVIVFVGGVEQTEGLDYIINYTDPVELTFVTAPPDGKTVTIAVRRGYSLYGTQSGTALQEIDNKAVRFLES